MLVFSSSNELPVPSKHRMSVRPFCTACFVVGGGIITISEQEGVAGEG